MKATNAATDEIIGFICWTIEYADNEKSISGENLPDLNATASQRPNYLDMDFIKFYAEKLEVEVLRNNLMKGHTHYYANHFAVAPKYWSQGVGT
ncbi:hypothetical protein SBOR_8318 [Sclerotinia borealis F-4128]|uniref:Uncharacterized protein n=1 Tax=Sclerotinia borealis (strain F-4128) TaxID=1432307 RepID=W9C8V3_SCLBF|nr:hypothetical protein SBOR_8318 [Sclerotinia borealis F-4128]